MKIFLDDNREIIDAYKMWNDDIFKSSDWIIVRNYNQFVDFFINTYIEEIELISFDHDLADFVNGEERTGYDCAKWLVNFCINNEYKLPKYFIHSANPIGRMNIDSYLQNYKRTCQD